MNSEFIVSKSFPPFGNWVICNGKEFLWRDGELHISRSSCEKLSFDEGYWRTEQEAVDFLKAWKENKK